MENNLMPMGMQALSSDRHCNHGCINEMEMQLGNRPKKSTHFVTTKWSTEAKQLATFPYITKGEMKLYA